MNRRRFNGHRFNQGLRPDTGPVPHFARVVVALVTRDAPAPTWATVRRTSGLIGRAIAIREGPSPAWATVKPY